MSAGIHALQTLTKLGYRAWVEGGAVRLKYEGQDKPDPAQVAPLLEAVKTHKLEVVGFLRCYCPKCGGCCFVPVGEQSLCMGCDWQRLTEIFPALRVKH